MIALPTDCRRCFVRSVARLACLLILVNGASVVHAEDGYDLWLRYRPVETPWIERYRAAVTQLVPPDTATGPAMNELTRGIKGLLDANPAVAPQATRDGAIVFG